MLLTFAVSGYRSLRDLILPLDRITLITGANGSGKSSLYRSIRLLAEVAQGTGDRIARLRRWLEFNALGWSGNRVTRHEAGRGAGARHGSKGNCCP
jgi:predicted ATPase